MVYAIFRVTRCYIYWTVTKEIGKEKPASTDLYI